MLQLDRMSVIVVYFFIYVSFRAVVSSFSSLSVQLTQFCFLLFLLYRICVDKINIHSFIVMLMLQLQV